jgi:hypothetical protein
LNIQYLNNNPAAYLRRFLFIEPIVKPQYLKEGTCAIDPSKCTDGRFMDRWTFVVHRIEPVNEVATMRIEYLDGGKTADIDKLTDLLRELFTQHINIQEQIRQKVADPKAMEGYGTIRAPVVEEKVDDSYGKIKTESLANTIFSNYQFFPDYTKMLWGMGYGCLSLFLSLSIYVTFSMFSQMYEFRSFYQRCIWKFRIASLIVGCISVFTGAYTPVMAMTVIGYVFGSAKNWTSVARDSWDVVKRKWSSLKSWLATEFVMDQFVLPANYKLYSSIVAGGVMFVFVYKMVCNYFGSDVNTEALSQWRVDVPINEELTKKEVLFHCGSAYKRVSNKMSEKWNVRNVLAPSVHTSSMKDLESSIARNVRLAQVTWQNNLLTTHLLGIKENFAIINSHALGNLDKGLVLKVSKTGVPDADDNFAISNLSKDEVIHLGSDISLVRVSGISFRDISAHLSEGVNLPRWADGLLGNRETKVSLIEAECPILDARVGKIVLQGALKYDWEGHAVGMCGLPLIVNTDRGSSIAGIHVAGHRDTIAGYATIVRKSIILNNIEKMRDVSPFMSIYSESAAFFHPLEEPTEKSPFRYEHLPGLEYYGKLPGPVLVHNKSRLKESVFVEHNIYDEFYKNSKFIPGVKYGKPCMQPKKVNGEYISPVNNALRKMSCQRKPLDHDVLAKVIDIITKRILSGLKDRGITKLQPLNMEEAINGSSEDYFSRRVAHDTSAGFGLGGKKGDHIPIVEEKDGYLCREPTEDLKKRLNDQLENYLRRERNQYVFNASLKDEPREQSKCDNGSTRVFYASALDNLILSKQYLQPFYTLMCQFNELFCTAVGIDMHSKAHEFRKMLADFSHLFMEGDYEKFDQSMPFDIGYAAATIVHNVLKFLGYNENAMAAVDGLLSDSLFIYLVMYSDFFLLAGLQPSGKYATAEDNGLRGLIMLLYAWLIIPETKDLDFFEFVKPATYGDDLVAAVKEAVAKFFNNNVYAKIVKEVYGMGFTTAQKGKEMTDFLNINEISFLKRKFVFKPEIGRYVAPLDMNSIFKSLYWNIPSASINPQEQHVAIVTSALRELFFACDEKAYNSYRNYFIYTLCKVYKIHEQDLGREFPTYESLVVQYSVFETQSWSAGSIVVDGRRYIGNDPVEVDDQEYKAYSMLCQYRGYVYPLPRYGMNDLFLSIIDGESCHVGIFRFSENRMKVILRAAIEEHEANLDEARRLATAYPSPYPGLSYTGLKSSYLYSKDRRYQSAVDKHIYWDTRIKSLEDTVSSLRRDYCQLNYMDDFKSNDLFDTEAQRGIIPDSFMDVVSDEEPDTHMDVVGDDEMDMIAFYTQSAHTAEQKMGEEGMATMVREQNVIDIAGNLPVDDMTGYRMPSSIISDTHLNMSDFLSRPVKLAHYDWIVNGHLSQTIDVWSTFLNFPAIRAKLRNSAYLFGNMKVRINLAGSPFHAGKLLVAYIPMARDHEVVLQYMSAAAAFRPNLLRYLVQVPGAKIMDVKDNAPLDITIPFISPKRSIRLFNDATAALGTGTNFADTTNMGTLFIYSLNAASCVSASPSDLSVFVYGHMEDVELGCTTGTQIAITTESKDERIAGPVERFASRSAEVMGMLTSVPIISPYARASEIVLKAVSNVASIFGFSVSTINTQPAHMKNQPFQNAANTIGYDTGKRITLDPKQEISVDPRIVAVSEDEMSIAYINSVTSLLDQPIWFSNASVDVPFWSCAVNPRASRYILNDAKWNVQPTALAYASTPFTFWRGSIDYTIQVVCSAFHRGKLAVFYEPNMMQSTLINGAVELNKHQLHIIDLQQTQEVTVRVEWAFPRAWARVADNTVAFSMVGDLFSTSVSKFEYANGYIGIFPLTELVSPDDSNIGINVFCKSEDMQYNVLRENYFPSNVGIYDVALDFETESMHNVLTNDCTTCVLNPTCSTTEGLSELHFGEVPASFRALLKRFAVTQVLADAGDAGLTKHIVAKMPIIPLLQPSVITSMTYPCLLNYLRYAYLAMRGGLRKRLHFTGISTNDVMTHLKVSLAAPSSTILIPGITYSGNPTSNCPLEGTVTFMPHTNGGVEFELPFYTNNLFGISGSAATWDVGDSAFDTLLTRNYTVTYEVTGANLEVAVAEETAAAEDFSLARWISSVPFYMDPVV